MACVVDSWRTVDYYVTRARANLQIIDKLDLVGQTSEFARIFGIEFFHAIFRGSQVTTTTTTTTTITTTTTTTTAAVVVVLVVVVDGGRNTDTAALYRVCRNIGTTLPGSSSVSATTAVVVVVVVVVIVCHCCNVLQVFCS